MRAPILTVMWVAVAVLLAMVAYHALGEAALIRSLFYLSVAAFVGGLIWLFGSDD